MYQFETRHGLGLLSLILTGSLLLTAQTANALNLGCGPNALKDHRSIVKKVVIVGEENRKTVSEYANAKNMNKSDVESLTSGTGILSCGEAGGGTGNLVGNQLVVVTVSHIFYDDNCKLKPLKSCALMMHENGKFTALHIDLSSIKTGGCPNNSSEKDWAVLKLRRPAPKRFKPYALPKKFLSDSDTPPLSQVAAMAENFKAEGDFTKNIVDCSTTQINPPTNPQSPRQLVTNCDSGLGSSGGAVFLETEFGKTLAALNSGGSDYMQLNWSTLVEGDFLQTIKSAINK